MFATVETCRNRIRPQWPVWCTLDGEGHVIDGLEHLLLAGQLEFLGQVVDGDDVLALFERAFAGDVVIEQSVRILTTLLGGDDALGGQRRGSGHQSLGVRVLRVLEHFKDGPDSTT